MNTMVVTLHKGKTVTGCIELVAKAQQLGWGVVVASETFTESGGETCVDVVAHLAVGTKVWMGGVKVLVVGCHLNLV